jgi:hypothetical protein
MRDSTRDDLRPPAPSARRVPGGARERGSIDASSVLSDAAVDSGFACGACGRSLPVGGLVCDHCQAAVVFEDEDATDWGAPAIVSPPDRPDRPARRPLPRFAGLLRGAAEDPALRSR